MGLLLTLIVVAVSAWRVSVMTIAAAIRGLPEPGRAAPPPPACPRPRRSGARRPLVYAGLSGDQSTPFNLGVSLGLMSLVPLLRLAGVSERFAFTACGIAVVAFLMLPWRWQEAVFGQLAGDFSTWIVAGLLIVIGTVWVIVYNADLLLGGVTRLFGRFKGLAPVLRMSMAYPLRARFRTGTTLAMFTLVVFTLVTGSAANGSFVHALGVDDYGGGFQVRAGTVGAAPVEDMATALRTAPGIRASEIPYVGSQSVLAVEAKQLGAGRPYETYLVRGLDDSFLAHSTFGFGQTARGYDSAEEVWHALRTTPGLAVVDSMIVPRRDSFGFGSPPDFALSGFLYEEGALDPIPVEVLDKQTGRTKEAHRDRGSQGHRSARDARHHDLAGDPFGRLPRSHAADDPLLRPRARRRRGGHGREARVRVPAERPGRAVDPGGRRRHRRGEHDLQPPDPGVPRARPRSWASRRSG